MGTDVDYLIEEAGKQKIKPEYTWYFRILPFY